MKWTFYTLACTILSEEKKGEVGEKMINALFYREAHKCREDHEMIIK